MSHPNKPKARWPGLVDVETIRIRKAAKTDVSAVADLIVRVKRLNSEFDPLFGVTPDAKERAERYIADSIGSPKTTVLVALDGDKIIGVLRAEIRERLFYLPRVEGYITEFYILPEHRRKQLGHEILNEAAKGLMKMGAEIIVAELPSRNEIGVHFYSKRGFRRLLEVFALASQ